MMKANRTWTNSEINWEVNAFPFKSSRESKPSAQPYSENFCMQFWSIEFNIRFFLILQIWAQFLNLISTISRCLALKLRWGVVPSTVGRWTNSLTASSRWREPPQVSIPPRHIDLKWLAMVYNSRSALLSRVPYLHIATWVVHPKNTFSPSRLLTQWRLEFNNIL